MKTHLPLILRAVGLLLVTSVLAISAYSYYSAQHLLAQLSNSYPTTIPAGATQPTFTLGAEIDLISHDTYYVIASPIPIVIAIATLALGLFLLACPNLIIKHLQRPHHPKA